MSTAFNSDVALTLEVGGQGPWNTTSFSGDWSPYLRDFSIRIGRATGATSRVSAGQMSFTLDNNLSYFSPGSGQGQAAYMSPGYLIRLVATYDSTDYVLFLGTIGSITVGYPNLKDTVARVVAYDGIRDLNLDTIENIRGYGIDEETADERIDYLLQLAGVPAGRRNLETSSTTVQAYTSGDASTLSLIRQVEDTEGGLFYFDRTGDARFHDKAFRDGASSVATFSDSGSDLPYSYAEFGIADDDIQNQVIVTTLEQDDSPLVSGGPYESTVSRVDAPTSQFYYGARELSLTTLHVSESDAFSHASDLAATWRTPRYEVKRLDIDGAKAERQSTGAWDTILGFDLGQLITVQQEPMGNDLAFDIDLDVFIESVTHSASARTKQWDTTLVTSLDFSDSLLTPSGSLEPSDSVIPN